MKRTLLAAFALFVTFGIGLSGAQDAQATATAVRILDPVVATNYGPAPTTVEVTFEFDVAHCSDDVNGVAYTAQISIGAGGSVAQEYFTYSTADIPDCDFGGTYTKTETVTVPAGTDSGVYDLAVYVTEWSWPGCCGAGDSEVGVVVIGVPLTADDCKKGGWMTLIDSEGNSFKNQGDCVSFVATQGSNLGAIAP